MNCFEIPPQGTVACCFYEQLSDDSRRLGAGVPGSPKARALHWRDHEGNSGFNLGRATASLPLHGASGREVAVDVDLASETSVGLLLSLRVNYSNNGATGGRPAAACLGVPVAAKKRSASAVHCSKEVLVLSMPRSQVDALRCHCARLNPTSQRIAAAELCSVRTIHATIPG